MHFYGDGPYKQNLVNRVHTLGLDNDVFFEGNVSRILHCIADSRIYVFSSRHEGMPNSLLEAMALGLPCVSTDCQFGPSELIENGVNGLLVPVDDSAKMCDAMLTLAKSEALSKLISVKASEKRRTNCSGIIIEQYLSFFNKVLGE